MDEFTVVDGAFREFALTYNRPRFNPNDLLKPITKPIKVETKVGLNDPCPCGSGKKYKRCCRAAL